MSKLFKLERLLRVLNPDPARNIPSSSYTNTDSTISIPYSSNLTPSQKAFFLARKYKNQSSFLLSICINQRGKTLNEDQIKCVYDNVNKIKNK